VAVSQIAGALARRVVCRLRPGDRVEAGERFGMIRFGSRTDLVVPRTASVHVRVGDRVVGGLTIMAVIS
jgi:phosphatidylserine decarboxylase